MKFQVANDFAFYEKDFISFPTICRHDYGKANKLREKTVVLLARLLRDFFLLSKSSSLHHSSSNSPTQKT